MREVFAIASSGGVSDHLTCNSDSNKSKMESARVTMKMSSTPGYLELTEVQIKQLITQQPIEEVYEVEDEPFARGKYAAVRRCRNRTSGEQFAAKFLRKRRRSTDLRPEILHEVAILDACKTSSRIVRLHHVFETTHEMILLLEMAPGGELQMLLDRDEVPEEREVRRLMRQILAGLIDLHSINVAHLDIKPQNLVLTGEFPFCDVKLCDLGISRYISEATDIRDILGTPDYVAPEVLNYEPISLATDMWSVGVLLYVLLTGCSPFGGDTKQETFCNISLCNLDFPEDLFEDVSEDAKDLMRKLMVKEPTKRLTAQECLQHQWFKVVDALPLKCLPSTQLPVSRIIVAEPTVSKPDELRIKPIAAVPKKQENASDIATRKLPFTERLFQSTVSSSIQISGEDTGSNISCKSENHKDEKKDLESNLNERNASGIRSFTRSTFRRNMGNIVERINSSEVTEKENNIIYESIASKPAPRLSATSKKIPAPETPAENTSAYFFASRPVSKTTSVRTMLVNGTNGYKSYLSSHREETRTPIKKQQNANISHNISTENVVRRKMANKDCVYQFRRCYIIDDSEDDIGIVSPVNSLVSDGTNESETSSGYFDNSSCCSSSGSVSDVSETSVDSTGDRLSSASIEDSLDFNYSKNTRQRYARNTLKYNTTQNHNIWQLREARQTLNSSSTFSLTLSRFNSAVGTQKPATGNGVTQECFLTMPRKQPAKASHTSVINKINIASVIKASEKNTNGVKDCGINITRERNGNEVVLREMKGGRCSRFNEVKIESVQSRIRKFEN